MIYDQLFSDFLINNQKRIDFVRKELSSCPSGRLYVQEKNGRPYFIQSCRVNGKEVKKGISSKPELIQGLIRRQLLEAELREREKKQQAVFSIEKSYPDFNLQKEIKRLMTAYPVLNDDIIAKALYVKGSSWASESYEQSTFKPEERRQINSRGLKLRSKSELLISEKFYEFGIAFRYEQVLMIGQITLNPDFTIRRNDGKIFIWEHEGLTNVQSYLKWQQRKAELYASIGFVPWDNLIVTYDNADGIIDLRIVESEIKNKLLCC